ncbi:unnamed protein product [Heligmosomoides polygyrus]|uniref:Uncharacterized protein n=1 Tax=Heligmosomoides polygyrus TaxID=6339 RepID=A0A183GWT9_HELPZ|nr:unnamed protein product [Heligmosomoides polygyrus]
MSFSPAKVVSDLLADFGVIDHNDAPTREEKKIARRSDASTDEESDWNHCDDEGEENSSTTHENVIHFDTNIPAGVTSLIQPLDVFFSSAR